MCLAIYQSLGAQTPVTRLVEAARSNPDGFGYAFVRNSLKTGRPFIQVEKFLKFDDRAIEQYMHDVNTYGDDSPFLIHFRMTTHGGVSIKNVHPFTMKDGGAMIHNGIIDNPIDEPQGMSDTRFFVRRFIDTLPESWQWDQVLVTAVARYADVYWNKLVFLWPDRSYLIMGEDKGHWDDGVWYSNKSYLPYGAGYRWLGQNEDAWERWINEEDYEEKVFKGRTLLLPKGQGQSCEVGFTLDDDDIYDEDEDDINDELFLGETLEQYLQRMKVRAAV